MEILIGLGILLIIGIGAFAIHKSMKKPELSKEEEVLPDVPSNIGYTHKFEETHYPIHATTIRDERNMRIHDSHHVIRHRLNGGAMEVDGGDIGGAVEDLAYAGIMLVDAMQNGQEMDTPVEVTPEPYHESHHSYEAPAPAYEAPVYEAPSHSWGESSSSSSSSSWGESSSSSSWGDSSSSSCDCGGGGGD